MRLGAQELQSSNAPIAPGLPAADASAEPELHEAQALLQQELARQVGLPGLCISERPGAMGACHHVIISRSLSFLKQSSRTASDVDSSGLWQRMHGGLQGVLTSAASHVGQHERCFRSVMSLMTAMGFSIELVLLCLMFQAHAALLLESQCNFNL